MGQIKNLEFVEGVFIAAPGLAKLEVQNPSGSVPAEAVNVGYLTALGAGLKNNFAAVVAPTVTDSSVGGYAIGSRWINTVTDLHYILVDSTPGSALWRETVDAVSAQVLTNKTIGDNITILGTTQSTSKDTGAIVTEGGVGIEKNLYVGGNAVITGDLTVDGTTTTLNTTTLDVEDINITINKGGNDALSEGAGLTIDRTGTKGSIVYAAALASRFRAGALASEVEIATVSHTQTLTNKSIDADANTITNIDNADIKVGAAIARAKLASGTAYRVLANDVGGVVGENPAITASRALASDANGQIVAAATTAAELGHVSGVTSPIQTQLGTKLDNPLTTTGDLIYSSAGATPARLGIGTNGHVLTLSGGLPVWATTGAGGVNAVELKDNLIIDGNLTNWENNASYTQVALDSTKHMGVLWQSNLAIGSGPERFTVTREASLPSGVPTGFSCRYEVQTANASVGAGHRSSVRYFIEGYDFAKIFGKSFTFNFWVMSSTTGTYCVTFRNTDNMRNYIVEYSVTAANTWEEKTMTVAHNTTGTWNLTNGRGMQVQFVLLCGTNEHGTAGAWTGTEVSATSNQTNIAATAGNYMQFTGMMLYEGADNSQDFRPWLMSQASTQLAIGRYYQKSYAFDVNPGASSGIDSVGYYIDLLAEASGRTYQLIQELRVSMRAAPTVTVYSVTGDIGLFRFGNDTITPISISNIGNNTFRLTGTATTSSDRALLSGHYIANARL